MASLRLLGLFGVFSSLPTLRAGILLGPPPCLLLILPLRRICPTRTSRGTGACGAIGIRPSCPSPCPTVARPTRAGCRRRARVGTGRRVGVLPQPVLLFVRL